MAFFWLLLGLLGIFTYTVIQRSVRNLTRTPVWLLWLVMMAPAFTWASWVLLNGENEPMPLLLLVGPFIISPIIYWFLVQWGRVPSDQQRPTPPTSTEPILADALPILTENATPQRAALRPITKDEEITLKGCFPWSIYYVQTIEYRPQALVCRGQLRTSPEIAYDTIRRNILEKFGDRFLVMFQEGLNGKPFFALVPNPYQQAGKSGKFVVTARPGLSLGLFLATLITTTLAGMLMAAVMNGASEIQFTLSAFLHDGLPYALTLMVILGCHEFGHYWMARRHRIQSTLPYFIPVPPAAIFPFGTFGAFIQMQSPVPHRKALFDVGIAGPLVGFVVSLPLVIWGLAHSTTLPLTEESGLFNFASFNPHASLLLTLLSRLALGADFTMDVALNLHPVAIAGCLGIVVTALNLMPVGQLDGGHIVHAMFGQRTGALIGQVARFLILALSFVQREFLLWAILLFFMPIVDEPTLNDVTELDNQRDFWGLLSLTILIIIILPAPKALMHLFL
jgi:membrane-associated protease RseP (regulator of RpoE activity)